MPLALARHMSPGTPFVMAAALAGARRPRHRPGARDWLRIAHRLAAGMPPRAAALPEGGDEALVLRLLERPEFRGVVEGARDDLAMPPEARRRRLVILAHQALERALALDDAPAAVFVLEEEAQGRDPAVTLAEGVLKAEARALRPPAGPASKPRPGRHRYDPLRAMMDRGAARLRHDVQAEDAVRRAALHAAAEPPRTTAEGARRALALKAAATGRPLPARRPADAGRTPAAAEPTLVPATSPPAPTARGRPSHPLRPRRACASPPPPRATPDFLPGRAVLPSRHGSPSDARGGDAGARDIRQLFLQARRPDAGAGGRAGAAARHGVGLVGHGARSPRRLRPPDPGRPGEIPRRRRALDRRRHGLRLRLRGGAARAGVRQAGQRPPRGHALPRHPGALQRPPHRRRRRPRRHPRHRRQGLERHPDPDPRAAARDLVPPARPPAARPQAAEAAVRPARDRAQRAAAGQVRRRPLRRRHRHGGRAGDLVHRLPAPHRRPPAPRPGRPRQDAPPDPRRGTPPRAALDGRLPRPPGRSRRGRPQAALAGAGAARRPRRRRRPAPRPGLRRGPAGRAGPPRRPPCRARRGRHAPDPPRPPRPRRRRMVGTAGRGAPRAGPARARGGRGPDVTELPVIPQPAQRNGLFTAARDAFAPVLAAQGYVIPTNGPSAERLQRLVANDDFERPLAVQMEALLWLASATPGAGSTGIDKLLDRVLGLERAHWRKLLGALDDEGVRDLARGVGQVTLVQGVDSHRAAERLLMADSFFGESRRTHAAVEPLVRGLGRLYGRGDAIAPLEPDLIGEHHVAVDRVGDAELLSGCLAWIEQQPEESRPKHRRDLLTVLQRATQPEHGGRSVGRVEALLDLIITAHTPAFAAELVSVTVDTPGRLAQTLDLRIGGLGEDALEALDAHLPLRSLSLLDVSLKVAERRAELGRALVLAGDATPDVTAELREGALSHLAARLGTLGIRLSALGRREEALAASQEAVDIRRRLAAARPDAFLPDLATSVSVMSDALAALDRHEEAARAAVEALEILVPFVERYPGSYSGLARTIGSDILSYSQAAGGEPDLALLERVVRALGGPTPDA